MLYEVITGVKEALKLEGTYNFLFLAGIVGSVLMSGMVDWGEVNTFGIHRSVQDWVRDGSLILIVITSYSIHYTKLYEYYSFLKTRKSKDRLTFVRPMRQPIASWQKP